MEYEFPFDVPEDIKTLNRKQTEELFQTVKAHGRELSADENATPEALSATHELFSQLKERRDAFTAAAKNAADFTVEDEPVDEPAAPADEPADESGDDGTDDGESADEPENADALTAAEGGNTPKLRKVAGRAPKVRSQVPANADTAFATMAVAADVPNFVSGTKLESFDDASRAIEERLASYGEPSSIRQPSRISQFAADLRNRATRRRDARGRRSNVVLSSTERAEILVHDEQGRVRKIENFTRHGAVRFRRNFPDDQRLLTADRDYDKLLKVADERRLPGGSLVMSAQKLVEEQGKSLTAAAGWCAPSETIYQLCELESLDGILDVPEIQADRGGFNIPEDGGIDFSTIWNGIGNAGDTHLSEYDVQNDTTKVCYDVPCPDFVDTRLGVDYFCLSASLLQRRGYPEVISRVSRGAVVALAHKINRGVIADIVTAAGAATTLPVDLGGDDAASALLGGVELGLTDMKYRHRMPFGQTVEAVMPMFALPVIRAALSRRSGVGLLGVSDAQILEWFRIRGAVPRFVYDWQDALSGVVGGLGGATAVDTWPATMSFVIYPAGTFTKAVQSVVSLDTIYDSTKLATNEYTAMFVEDGWAVLQTCPDARQYTIAVDVSGCVGCIGAGTQVS